MAMANSTIVILALFILWPCQAGAMFKCVDARGKVSYTDVAMSDSCVNMDLGEDITVHIGDGSTFRLGGQLSGIFRKANQYDRFIDFYAVRYNIDPHLIRAVIRIESGFNPRAVSKKGARGLMQLMPDTAKELNVTDSFDPKQNIEGGTRYLRSLLDTFKEDLRLALAAYNAGPTVVKQEMKVPSFPETVSYVQRVLQYYREYKKAAS